MPYFINVYRVPKPGQFTAVARGVEESLKATGRPGNVTVSISPPMPTAGSMAVVSTTAGFETADDVDAFFDGILGGSMAEMAARDELSAKCDLINLTVSRVVGPVITAPEGFVPKIMNRNFVVAKPGKLPALLELLQEWGEELDVRGAGVVSVPLGGQPGALRTSQLLESLQALEDFREQIAASPRLPKLLELIDGPVLRGVGRITYSTQG